MSALKITPGPVLPEVSSAGAVVQYCLVPKLDGTKKKVALGLGER